MTVKRIASGSEIKVFDHHDVGSTLGRYDPFRRIRVLRLINRVGYPSPIQVATPTSVNTRQMRSLRAPFFLHFIRFFSKHTVLSV